MTIRLCFKFNTNLSCLKLLRTLSKNDDTLLEFGRTWQFLIGAGVLDHFFMYIFDENMLMFQVS